MKLLHLSDLHASDDVPVTLIEHAVDIAVGQRPDLICVTGDFITYSRGFDAAWYTSVLGRLVAAAPTFAVLGNHDGGLWAGSTGGFRSTSHVARMVERSGIELLTNRSVSLTLRTGVLQMAGVADLWSGDLDGSRTFRSVSPNLPTILLAHNPDSKSALGNYPWDLMLSGHTHGGQVVVPFLGLNPAPVQDRRYIRGMKPWNDRWIHVSRGVGNAAGVRFNCRPEVTSIELLPQTVLS